ncbi:MAG: hypothetical protein AAF222_03810 [Pseudomonadota bacterium]
MKAMLSAFAVMGLISVGAYYGLSAAGFGSDERQSSDSVRID